MTKTASGSSEVAGVGDEALPSIFVARQPILDQRQNVTAYELLYRSGPEDFYSTNDGDFATRSVIGHSLITFGLSDLTHGRRAFINFTVSLLAQQTALVLPPDKIVVEIAETAPRTPDVLRACWALKRAGYSFALDNVVALPSGNPFLVLADFVKVDFLRTNGEQRRDIAQTLKARHHTLIAERVETRDEFAEAASLGFQLFQGNFFQKPEIVSRQSIPSSKLASLQLVKELNQPEVDWQHLEQALKQDVALPMKLLRYLNSAWFGRSQRVDSLRHAMIMLGIDGLRQWVSLVVVTDLGQDKAPELITVSLLRAAMCERLAKSVSLGRASSNLFLVGLFSSLDVLIGRPLSELLNDLAVPEGVRDALLGRPGQMGDVYRLVLAYEGGDWNGVTDQARFLGIDEKILPAIYSHAVEYVGHIVTAVPSGKR